MSRASDRETGGSEGGPGCDDHRVETLLSRLDGIQCAETAAAVPLVSGTFPAGEHDRVWRALRAEQPRTGLWPVLGWTADNAAEGTYQWCREQQGPAWLAVLREVDPAERMALIIRSKLEWTLSGGYLTEPQVAAWQEEDRAGFDPVRVAAAISPLAEIPPGVARHTRSYPPTSVLLVPAAAGHEVLALVPGLMAIMNNWMGGPSHPDLLDVDHVFVLRHWEKAWGAELYAPDFDGLELLVTRPPRDPLAAAICAIEQWSSCDDLEQILGDVHDVARRQAPAGHWSFWWD
ncbi:DUF4253 domain-containing protein [Micromonospora sp. CPCC 205556]|uniref:DUF4253 domain-containing protein n=1 Tax=Micromonospora sp. CPCC 205556 TaxID=3122398 RepID=UPI002FF164A3